MDERNLHIAELVRYFIDTDRMHRTLAEERVGAVKLHRSQHMMLRSIEHCEAPPTQRQLAEMLGISAATVAVTVKKLEAEGYIRRQMSQEDSRCNRLSLTEKGKTVLLQVRDLFTSLDIGMFEGIPDEELVQFAGCLKKIRNNLAAMGAQIPGPPCAGKIPRQAETGKDDVC